MGMAVSMTRTISEYGSTDAYKHGTELLNAVKAQVGEADYKKL